MVKKTQKEKSADIANMMSPRRVSAFYQRLAKANPHPKGELEHINHYTLLVAIVLSAQATDKGVNKATKPLFTKIKTPEAMVKLGEEKLRGYIKSIGLYRTKAKNVMRLSEILCAEHDGKVPRDPVALEKLPGVGRKTVNVLLNMAFGVKTIAVDTHVFRVSNRTGLALGKTPLEIEEGLMARTPEKFLQHAHHWLILHGRYVCKARLPSCKECLVEDLCGFDQKNL